MPDALLGIAILLAVLAVLSGWIGLGSDPGTGRNEFWILAKLIFVAAIILGLASWIL